MRIGEMFPSKFVKAADVEDQPLTLEIAGVEAVELEGQKKYSVAFEESDKQLILNVTNAKTIANLYGDDTRDWIGKRIKLFAQQVDFRGEQVMAIRVSLAKPVLATDGSEDEQPF